jgi:hypothetical protein
MSNVVSEEEFAAQPEVTEAEVSRNKRDPRNLRETASGAAEGEVELILAAHREAQGGGAEGEEPEGELGVERAAAVQAARQAGQPPVAENEAPELPDPEDAAEQFELPPPAPVEWSTEEPDFEAEARAEVEAEIEDPEVEDYTYEDPRVQEERVRRVAAEKRLSHVEGQRLKEARKAWVGEALEHAPLAAYEFGDDLSGIEAKSHREFLRKAAEGHNKVRGIVEATHAQAAQALVEEAAEIRAEAKERAAAAFGAPTAGPGVAPAKAGDAAAAVAAGREKRGLRGAIRAMLDSDTISP